MDVNGEIREALGRLRPSHRRLHAEAVHALDLLDDARIELLARYQGQPLSELQSSFQLLPLGTRLALEQCKALTLHDKGVEYFHVDVHPFALHLVEAAVERTAERTRAAAGSLLEQEVSRIWDDRFTLKTDEPVELGPTLSAEATPVGTFEASGLLTEMDPRTGTAAIDVLNRSGGKVLAPQLRCELHDADSFEVGKWVRLDFVVGLPRTRRLDKFRLKDDTMWRRVEDDAGVTSGVVFVHVDKLPRSETVVSFDVDESPNAIAQLRAVVPAGES